MDTIDLKKELAAYLKPSSKQPEIVDVPAFNFLMIDGRGDPNTAQEYKDAMEALYGAAYALKFHFKKTQAIDYPVMASEGLWWAEDMRLFSVEAKDDWFWTMMILQPNVVTNAVFEQVRADLRTKKDLPALDRLRLDCFHEGLSAQIMHIGPYAAEAPTIEHLHRFIEENGYQLTGKHHEIYLSDPRRAAPDKMKTIIRQPIRR